MVYCDPPYVPLSPSANFTGYSAEGFTGEEQVAVAEFSLAAAERGAVVLVSNHDTPLTRKLYEQAAQIVPVLVSRTISCNGANRKKARELIAIFRS